MDKVKKFIKDAATMTFFIALIIVAYAGSAMLVGNWLKIVKMMIER